jgi:hypothetical protein
MGTTIAKLLCKFNQIFLIKQFYYAMTKERAKSKLSKY